VIQFGGVMTISCLVGLGDIINNDNIIKMN
jgi:hypothetical protein